MKELFQNTVHEFINQGVNFHVHSSEEPYVLQMELRNIDENNEEERYSVYMIFEHETVSYWCKISNEIGKEQEEAMNRLARDLNDKLKYFKFIPRTSLDVEMDIDASTATAQFLNKKYDHFRHFLVIMQPLIRMYESSCPGDALPTWKEFIDQEQSRIERTLLEEMEAYSEEDDPSEEDLDCMPF